MPSETDNPGTDEAKPSLDINHWSGTVVVAAVLCLVCSLLVSGTAVALRDTIAANKKINRQRNVLIAAGLFDSEKNTAEEVPALFEQVQMVAVQLPEREASADTAGQIVELPAEVPTVPIPADLDLAGIKMRETIGEVYVIRDESGDLSQLVLPVRGKGLWSTLRGYLALEANVDAGLPVGGITFYEHAETPGLGGEVDNPKWKGQWPEKKLFSEDWQPVLDVTKPGNANDVNEVDGMSGATVTSDGVENLVNYWLGPDGYGPFLERYRNGKLDL